MGGRVNIQVDLKNNDLLDKEIEQLIKGSAKQMARNIMQEEIAKEITRIVDAKLADAKKGEYYSSVTRQVTEVVAKRLSADLALDKTAIDKIIIQRIEDYFDSKIRKSYGGSIESFLQSYINKSIAQALVNMGNSN